MFAFKQKLVISGWNMFMIFCRKLFVDTINNEGVE